MLLLVSLIFGLLPLAGIGSMAASRYLFTVDGLFMTLILLAISVVFLLNVAGELRKIRARTKPEPARASANRVTATQPAAAQKAY